MEGLDRFDPRGDAPQVSLDSKVTGNAGGRVVQAMPMTLSFSDLGDTEVTTKAGEFDVRKLVVGSTTATEMTNEITYYFAYMRYLIRSIIISMRYAGVSIGSRRRRPIYP